MRVSIALITVLIACGGGGPEVPPTSGVDPAHRLMDLTPDELTTLCEWVVAAQGGAGHVAHCADGIDVTTQTVAACTASFAGASCAAVVGDIELCIDTIDGDSCELFAEPTCEVVFECAN